MVKVTNQINIIVHTDSLGRHHILISLIWSMLFLQSTMRAAGEGSKATGDLLEDYETEERREGEEESIISSMGSATVPALVGGAVAASALIGYSLTHTDKASGQGEKVDASQARYAKQDRSTARLETHDTPLSFNISYYLYNPTTKAVTKLLEKPHVHETLWYPDKPDDLVKSHIIHSTSPITQIDIYQANHKSIEQVLEYTPDNPIQEVVYYSAKHHKEGLKAEIYFRTGIFSKISEYNPTDKAPSRKIEYRTGDDYLEPKIEEDSISYSLKPHRRTYEARPTLLDQ